MNEPTELGIDAADPFSGAAPITDAPLRNCTEPEGLPAPGGTAVTVAIRLPPVFASTVVVAALVIVSVPLENANP